VVDAGNAGNTNGSGSTDNTNLLSSIYQDIDNAISRTMSSSGEQHYHGGKGDRWVSGGENWDGYQLPDLTAMVADPANPSQVDTVAGLWRTNGAAVSQTAENLAQSMTSLMKFWQGAAAQQAADSVNGSSSWIAAVGETAAKVADQVENAGGALRSAQSTMPGQPTNTFWAGFNSAAGGSAAGAVGGPFGAAAGAMVGGMASMFGASSDQNAQKQQAVQTMQRYETAAMSIDTSTPQFQAPPSWGPVSGTTASGTMSPINVTAPGAGLVVTSGSSLNGGGVTVPSFTDSSVGRWNALTGGGSSGALSGLGTGIGGAGAGGGGAGGGAGLGLFGGLSGGFAGETDAERRAAAGSGTGGPSGAAAVSAATREDPAAMIGGKPGAGSGAGLMEEVDGPGGGMGGGMMGGGMMGGMGGRGGPEGEHKRRIPFEDDPFLTGLKAAPRVIGLSSVDREDTEK
jgi:uncharacterized protein YukE